MSQDLPIHLAYNLGRLGQAGDAVNFSADEAERAALARLAGVLDVSRFGARILLKKLAPDRFAATFELAAEITQACVVTLEPLVARIAHDFTRELHFTSHPRQLEKDVTIAPGEDDAPEEIGSLHYDLAGPLLEEFVLAIDPYPRAPGAAFEPSEGAGDGSESPFAVLKTLKSGPKEAE